MLKFFKFILGSVIGGAIGSFLGLLLLISLFSAFFYASGSGQGADTPIQSVPKESYIVVDLRQSFGEFSPGGFSSSNTHQNIHDFVKVIYEASNDKKVKGLIINASAGLSLGWSKATDIRKALIQFKTSEKKIITYAETLDEKALYVTSVSDKIYMHKQGGFEWNGMASVPMFYKGLADKLKAKPVVFKAGRYKSAVEVYTQKQMSPESREQTEELIFGIWDHAIQEISKSRNIDPMELKSYAESASIRTVDSAKKVGLIDDTVKFTDLIENLLLANHKIITAPKDTTEDEAEEDTAVAADEKETDENEEAVADELVADEEDKSSDESTDVADITDAEAETLVDDKKDKVDSKKLDKKILDRILSLSSYINLKNQGLFGAFNSSVFTKKSDEKSDKIAVLVLEGAIMSGESTNDVIGSSSVVAELQKLRMDDKVKGLVLRINSPGGSALASDVIWEEVTKFTEYKPIYVSMADVAASGGYYIAAGADKIYAQENTVTGSIGVFSVLFNVKNTMNSLVGLNFDRVTTNKFSDIGSGVRDMSEVEKEIFQSDVKRIYEVFLRVVEKGRKFTSIEGVDNVAQGRVWLGQAAKESGLVDEIGDINMAIDDLATEVGLEDYAVDFYPKKNPIEGLILGLERFGAKVESLEKFINISSGSSPLNENTLLESFSSRNGEILMLSPTFVF